MPLRTPRVWFAASLLALAVSACGFSTSLAQRFSDAANEMNTASHFGRMDIAMEHVSVKARDTFLRERSAWGREIRVVDLELGGLNVISKEEAEARINISWMRANDPIIRTSEILQRWTEEKGRWFLVKEEIASGDEGLLKKDEGGASKGGPAAQKTEAKPAAPTHLRRERLVIREE
ncbi:hypothetical protein [Chondromyces crocatus]|uniref:Lipoprotein n=1 Tax=Chondromyces crocatus TaxID=52 RepID=A0A0K1ENV6_CHOCO|nr:hypothetical protein [Chondromyces crocatus]AKT42541.1 uncharacterized protein CMC5_067680 [Chondromyces crocatus]